MTKKMKNIDCKNTDLNKRNNLEFELYDDFLKAKFTAQKIAFKIFYALDENELSFDEFVDKTQLNRDILSRILDGTENIDMLTLVKIEDCLSINLFDKEINSPYNNIYRQQFLTFKTIREQSSNLFYISKKDFDSEFETYFDNQITDLFEKKDNKIFYVNNKDRFDSKNMFEYLK